MEGTNHETEEGEMVPKPKSQWTEKEKKMSKYNSRALAAIHCSLALKQFNLVQGCKTAKEAWDILQKHFEGTTKVKRSQVDLLASNFENLRMEEHESIADFSAHISSIAQEVQVLGKN